MNETPQLPREDRLRADVSDGPARFGGSLAGKDQRSPTMGTGYWGVTHKPVRALSFVFRRTHGARWYLVRSGRH